MSLKPKKVDFNELWTDLRETAELVLTLKKVDKEVWNTSFSNVYNLCVAHPEPFATLLYEETRKFLQEHVDNMLHNRVNPVSTRTADGDQPQLLKLYYDAWREYSKGVDYLHNLYSYLNQQYIRKQRITDIDLVYGNLAIEAAYDQMEIGEMGYDIWRTSMVEELNFDLMRHILEGIKADRENLLSDEQIRIMSGVMHSFVEVQVYDTNNELRLYQWLFECPLLLACGEYYAGQALYLLTRCTVSEYMEEVIRILIAEKQRARKFLHESSVPKLIKQCQEKFISDRIEFLYSELDQMVSTENLKDLRNLYIILKPVHDNMKTRFIQTFFEHIRDEGLSTISNLNGENIHMAFVEEMLKVHSKYTKMIEQLFENDALFLSALDKACICVVNRRPSDKQPCRNAEYVAKYCDTLLKKSKTTETEIDQKLNNNITIFKYVEDKDIYQKFYSRLLAKRLIHEQSHSMDAEEAMINRLKQACGYEFTNKLHRMFTDISLSTDLNNKFSNYLKTQNIDLGINLSIKVLQAGAWPLGPSQTVQSLFIPPEFEKATRLFEDFYRNSFSGRKLTWLHYMCQGELKLGYLKKPYWVTLQTSQMSLLMLFETCSEMSCKDIQSRLQLSTEMCQKYIQSLLDFKLLLADNERLDDDSKIRLNFDFNSKRTKFKISCSIMQKETPQEVEHTISAVDEDRKLYLQAAIVRIMKSRKVLKHNALIQEILTQPNITFTPSIIVIKKCIESLIDKQYIERTANSGDEYSYVA